MHSYRIQDPIDVIELGARQRSVGSIVRVKILGILAMIDDDETDWKVLTIALDDDKAPIVHDLNDVEAHWPGALRSLTDWLRMYKTAEGKKENKFGFAGKPQSAEFAKQVVEETHQAWKKLLVDASAKGKMKKVVSGPDIYTELALGASQSMQPAPG
eukprot:s3962_g2.t1